MEQPGIYIVPPYAAGPRGKRALRYTRRSPVTPATMFTPVDPHMTPDEHFPLQTVFAPNRPAYPRFVNRYDSREMLLVVDGSCVNNGRYSDAKGGCSFMFKGSASGNTHKQVPITLPLVGKAATDTPSGNVAFQLEAEGPTGESLPHTSNRAKLRAVIAALQFRPWDAEGWRRVVILTDLEYIVDGATAWMPRWVKRRWRKPHRGGAYLNRDLWEELQHRIDELRENGCEVAFWLARDNRKGESQFIAQAKAAAKQAARAVPDAQLEKFTKLCGIMV
ncbi:ribonuclease H [Diplogelasinospora grovesii]|uniref:Ribonuclease H n=1 Tax=Diplogelasinospora grovesii TaxID=303347 RepID=A0AAN6S0E5_9PEZI|nr:ribonuclease H [Diplogelasinospora grovesii]